MPALLRSIVLLLVLSPALATLAAPDGIGLGQKEFHASGRGDVVTTGSIDEGKPALTVARSATWEIGHGIRVRRAGDDSVLHDADAGWITSPGAPAGASSSHDPNEKVQGAASVSCAFSGVQPDTDGDGRPDPFDLCEVDLGSSFDTAFDEMRVRLRSTGATAAGDLRIRFLRDDRNATFELDLPALPAATWTEALVRLERRTGLPFQFAGGQRIVALQCVRGCDGLELHLDDLGFVKDLIGTVAEMKSVGRGAILTLDRPAGRSVRGETVWHDDTIAVTAWLSRADRPGGARLTAPRGIYYVNQAQLPNVGGASASRSLPIYNDTTITCAGPDRTTFRNAGGAAGGVAVLFRSAAVSPANIRIEQCGFDWNGWNLQDYAGVIDVSPQDVPGAQVDSVEIRHNAFFDSALPGQTGCDFGQDECATRQRHHVLVQKVDNVWIEDNTMSGGGRIKTGGGGLGRHMYIRRNTLDFINDNGITIVDTVEGITEHVEISDNVIVNPVTSGIFFGADGEPSLPVPRMILRDVTIARNSISGYYATAGIIGDPPDVTEDVGILDNVIVNSRDTDVRPGFHYVGGIVLARLLTARDATGLRVEGNQVSASGPHASMNIAGIYLTGPMSGLRLVSNGIGCDLCAGLDAGIWVRIGAFENLQITGNQIADAWNALVFGSGLALPSLLEITGGSIAGNTLARSRSPLGGQIVLQVNDGETIEAAVVYNRIENGTGLGILCSASGSGTLLLGDLASNTFSGNVAGDLSGCP